LPGRLAEPQAQSAPFSGAAPTDAAAGIERNFILGGPSRDGPQGVAPETLPPSCPTIDRPALRAALPTQAFDVDRAEDIRVWGGARFIAMAAQGDTVELLLLRFPAPDGVDAAAPCCAI
jgi:hypothetical protein